MATRDYGRYIAQAVNSVVAQTFADWELVIVDDGSRDDTAGVLKPYLADPRIRCVPSDALAQSRAKNLSARLGCGRYIAYLDADDAWTPTKLAAQLACFEAHPRAGLVCTHRLLMDGRGTTRPEQRTPPALHGESLAELIVANRICFSSVMLKRGVLEHLGGFDRALPLAIDYDLWLRIAQHYEMECVEAPLVLYRTGHANLSSRLADRVAVAHAILHRVTAANPQLPASAVAQGYTSMCHALAYVRRSTEPHRAMRWYARGLAWGAAPLESLRGLAVSLLHALVGPRITGVAENHSRNR